jgi:2,3-bisphosphoglycerate-dependent phosphoglycerate mutase
MGTFELLTPAAIDRRFATEAARRRQLGELRYRPPGGESLRDVGRRVAQFLDDIETRPDQRLLVVGHDATVLMLRAAIEGLTDAEVTDLMTDDPVRRWHLAAYNDISHLEDGTGTGTSPEGDVPT